MHHLPLPSEKNFQTLATFFSRRVRHSDFYCMRSTFETFIPDSFVMIQPHICWYNARGPATIHLQRRRRRFVQGSPPGNTVLVHGIAVLSYVFVYTVSNVHGLKTLCTFSHIVPNAFMYLVRHTHPITVLFMIKF